MVRLFRFHDFSFMRVAIADWTGRGSRDRTISTELADQLHAETISDHPNSLTGAARPRGIEACDSAPHSYGKSLLFDAWQRVIAGPVFASTCHRGDQRPLLVLGIGTFTAPAQQRRRLRGEISPPFRFRQ